MILLSDQQREIYNLSIQGYSIKQMALILERSERTIRTQRYRMMQKASANSFLQVAALFEANRRGRALNKQTSPVIETPG